MTETPVLITTTMTQIAKSNPSRESVTIKNHGKINVYLYDNPADIDPFIVLLGAPDATLKIPTRGPIWARVESGEQLVTVEESYDEKKETE